MELIRLSHGYFGGEANGLPTGQPYVKKVSNEGP
jgi:hypothetical protein